MKNSLKKQMTFQKCDESDFDSYVGNSHLTENEDNYIDKLYLSDIVNLLKCFVSYWKQKNNILKASIYDEFISKHSKYYFCYDKLSINISFID